ISGQAQPAVYDIDGDGEIGFGVLGTLSGNWLTDTAACDIYPAVADGIVNFPDFTLLAENWFAGVQ
ncbi:MAG: hypothetical protein PHF37_09325, partial [Phycisphaerae bacterium]|nr:hypothetical protein [Phycisphaerae bacterium]